MDKRVWLFIKKYVYSKKNGRLKTETFISMIGLIISVTILTTVLSIFSGYQKLLRKTILGVNSHIYIFSMKTDLLNETQVNKIKKFLSEQPQVKSYSLLITKPVVINFKGKVKGAMVRGIDPTETNLSKYVITGKKKPKKDEIIIGYRLAKTLNIKIGDRIKLFSPQENMFSIFGVKNRNDLFKVAGFYRSGMYEYDSSFIFMDRTKSNFFSVKNKYTLLEVKLYGKFITQAGYLAYKWNQLLGYDYQINSWIDYNGNLFSLLTLEKWVIFIIISFLIIISSFNIISSISTSIIKEKRNIGILKTFGVSNGFLKKIFLFRVLFTSFLSIILGEMFGVLLAFLATKQNFFKLKGDIYFIDKITADYNPFNFLIVMLVALIIIFFTSLIPLNKISKLKIVSILRF